MFTYYHQSNIPDWLKAFNRDARNNSFHAGKFGIALDVWRANYHMFRNYEGDPNETLTAWCDRNYPEIVNHEHAASGMGIHTVTDVRNHMVPRWCDCEGHYSLDACQTIIKAALATAQLPFEAENMDLVPKTNNLRQRWTGIDAPWQKVNVIDIENGIAIRAVILNKGSTKPPEALDTYLVRVVAREGSSLTPQKLSAGMCEEFSATKTSLREKSRREVIAAAKTALGVNAAHGRAINVQDHELHYDLTDEPFQLQIFRVAEGHLVEVNTTRLDMK